MAQHTLEECPSRDVQRRVLKDIIGDDLLLPAVVKAMVESEDAWSGMVSFCEDVISDVRGTHSPSTRDLGDVLLRAQTFPPPLGPSLEARRDYVAVSRRHIRRGLGCMTPQHLVGTPLC